MNGITNRKLLFVLGPVTGLVMFVGVVMMATFLTNREYREPYRAPAASVDPTPRAEGLAAERAAAEAAARAKPYVEAEYRTFPVPEAASRSGRSRSSTCCLRHLSLPSQFSRSSSR
jgi:hypothetical protein